MDTREITLLVFDEYANFHNENTQLRISPDLYKKVIHIQSRKDFIREYKKLKPDQKFALIAHVFHAPGENDIPFRGFIRFNATSIEADFNLQASLVSSGPSGDIMRDLLTTTGEHRTVYLYSAYHSALKGGNTIKPVTKAEIEMKSGAVENNRISQTKKVGIFLSHSSKDAVIVDLFKDMILNSGLNYSLEKIKFTSVDEHGIPGGIDIAKNLQDFLKNDTGLFIQFLSNSYVESRVCLNEEGAGWCLMEDKMFISILLPNTKSSHISWVKTHNKAIKINEISALLNLYENRKEFFKNVNSAQLNKKINEFLGALGGL
ncbi:MAG: hypothetical protein V4594_08390 [Bacteroidota bacterium]